MRIWKWLWRSDTLSEDVWFCSAEQPINVNNCWPTCWINWKQCRWGNSNKTNWYSWGGSVEPSKHTGNDLRRYWSSQLSTMALVCPGWFDWNVVCSFKPNLLFHLRLFLCQTWPGWMDKLIMSHNVTQNSPQNAFICVSHVCVKKLLWWEECQMRAESWDAPLTHPLGRIRKSTHKASWLGQTKQGGDIFTCFPNLYPCY